MIVGNICPTDKMFIKLLDALIPVVTNTTIDEWSMANIRSYIRSIFTGQVPIIIDTRHQTDSNGIRGGMYKFTSVVINGKITDDVVKIKNAIDSTSDTCEFVWGELTTGSNEYISADRDIEKLTNWYKMFITEQPSMCDYTYSVSVSMAMESLKQLLMLVFLEVNPIPVNVNDVDFDIGQDVDDLTLLPYMLTLEEYINHWSVQFSMAHGMIDAIDPTTGEYIDFIFFMEHCINLEKETSKTSIRKNVPNVSFYKITPVLKSIYHRIMNYGHIEDEYNDGFDEDYIDDDDDFS